MAQGLDQEVQSAKRRPVLFGLFALAAVIFAIWYMTGGSAVGSPHQAEQLILTNQSPYGTATPAQTVHCTQNSQRKHQRSPHLDRPTNGLHLLRNHRHRPGRVLVRHVPSPRQPIRPETRGQRPPSRHGLPQLNAQPCLDCLIGKPARRPDSARRSAPLRVLSSSASGRGSSTPFTGRRGFAMCAGVGQPGAPCGLRRCKDGRRNSHGMGPRPLRDMPPVLLGTLPG
jgi:hypothetical protein